jgi:hypothetical protein
MLPAAQLGDFLCFFLYPDLLFQLFFLGFFRLSGRKQLERHLDRCQQHPIAGVLDDIAVRSDLLGFVDDLGFGVRGEKNHRQIPVPQNRRGGFSTVHPWTQVDIHQDQIDTQVGCHRLNRRFARIGDLDMIAGVLQQHLLDQRDLRLVFHQ